ncbi:serine hydrolase [Bradyrhizobium manausense]|uniref:serine hydrolase n=1 Tax=Bradyrhizobium TaxID=374 RepID=UPI001BAE3F26|nr:MULTISPECIES: serine hydrolase [Bradyrhizobium]MBR0828776.1 serine hydrolase [Bradyrhizobium manausense]UVO32522.1 serine hydrolase [Bradyrhizobium arachidis]
MLHRRSVLLGGSALLLGGRLHAQSTPERDLVALLQDHVDVGRETMGLVAGRIVDGHRIVASHGRSGSANGRPLDADTVFEIGSITKVFTALLLADMVLRGELALDDPASKFLPAGVAMPELKGVPISLLDLATYTSGLPNMPDNFAPKDPANPYADYTSDRLYDFLARHKLAYVPGKHYEYANLGFGLLGHILELRAGKSYEDLVTSRIAAPLGMDDTRITLSSAMRERLAQGHNTSMAPVANWDLAALAGAGALRSTANDLFKFLEAYLGMRETPLAEAMKMTLSIRRPRETQRDVAMGWFVSTRFDDEVIWKDGGTGGYATVVGYSTKSRKAAILLSNANDYTANLSLGMNMINPAYEPPKIRRVVPVDAALLAAYAGRYQIVPTFVLTVRADGIRLFVQATGQAEFEVFAESDTDFFYRAVNAQLTFARPEGGAAAMLTLHQNGKDMRGTRLP